LSGPRFFLDGGLPSSHAGSINGNEKCGPMPNAMAAPLNIGGALCSTPQSFADAPLLECRVPCSNAAKEREKKKDERKKEERKKEERKKKE